MFTDQTPARPKLRVTTTMQAVRARVSNCQVSVLSAAEDRTGLIPAFLKLRKQIFVDHLGWNIPHSAVFEAEQYDRADSVYVVVHDGSSVLAGARLLNTTSPDPDGRFSYMIRDAYLHRLPGLPSEICGAAPTVDPKVWELTRLVTYPGIQLSERILQATDQFLASVGAEQCLFLGSPAFMRMASRMGYATRNLGAIQHNQDGCFLAFSTNVLTPHSQTGTQ